MDLKINYTDAEKRANNKMARYYSIAGVILLAADIFFNPASFSFEVFFSWKNTPLMFIVIAAAMYFTTLFQIKNGYATLSRGKLTRNTLIKKSIVLDETVSIRKFAGDYIFKTDHKELSINTKIITPESLENLDQKIEELGIPWN